MRGPSIEPSTFQLTTTGVLILDLVAVGTNALSRLLPRLFLTSKRSLTQPGGNVREANSDGRKEAMCAVV